MEDYKEEYELGSIVTAKRTYNGEIITGEFGGFHLLDKSDSKSIVGVVYTSNGSYDVCPDSIKSVSEDEKIKEDLIQWINEFPDVIWRGHNTKDVIAWLKKQGLQKQRKEWDADDLLNYNQIMHILQDCNQTELIDWLEKQGEQSKQHLYDIIIALWDLLDKIDTFSDLQIDDINPDNPFRKIEHITQERHKFVKSDGYNLYIKGEQITDFKQDEQKPADKVEPKFKVGDTIVEKDVDECDYETIKDIKNGRYIFTDGYCMNIDEQERWQLVKTPTNKVESKFKVGDWITNGGLIVGQVTSFDEEYYYYMYEGIKRPLHISNANNWHLWTIQDAKDGDVLELDCGIGIFKDKCIDGCNIHCYCYYSNEGVLEINKDSLYDTYQSHPATKEQRDQLEKAMTNAGYTFDFEKKELKKIEQTYFQKQEWTGYDEKAYEIALLDIDKSPSITKNDSINWLKSLKERMKG